MNKELTEIVLIVDRSGSMSSCKLEAQNGINNFIKEQKELEGQANLTLVQFDDQYEFVHEGVAINDVAEFKLVPRGMTALLDAIGRAVSSTGDRLSKLDEADRPGLVAVLIVTDGHENSSHEYKLKQIKAMITEQKDKYNWQFTFLGADPSAFGDAHSMGIKSVAEYNINNTNIAYASSSANISRMRSATMYDVAVKNEYTSDEIKAMK